MTVCRALCIVAAAFAGWATSGRALAEGGSLGGTDVPLITADLAGGAAGEPIELTYTAGSNFAGPVPPGAWNPPSATTAAVGEPGPIGYIEYLFWGAHREGMDVYRIADSAAGFLTTRVGEVGLGRDNGLRTGFGYRFSTKWDVSWNYTYYATDGGLELDVAALPATALVNLQQGSIGPTYAGGTNGTFLFRSQMNYHVNDLEFGRWLNLDSSAAFRIFGGFRWAILDQQLSQQWSPNDGATLPGSMRGTINMDGYGIRLGSEGRWIAGAGLSAFGRGSVSILSGHFNYNTDEDWPDGGLPGPDGASFQDSTTQAVPVLEAALGLSWKYKNIELSGGYELGCWFNMANRYEGGVPVSNDLLLDGLFFRLAYAR